MRRTGYKACTALSALALLLLAPACRERAINPAPPRIADEAVVPVAESSVSLPVGISLDDLERALNAEVPTTLYAIDRQESACIPAQRVRGLRVTPAIGCRIVGEARRGRIRLAGAGSRLSLTMPVTAELQARDVGRLLSKTATAAATVRADVRLGMTPDWQPTAKVSIDYDWTREPGTMVLGRRITFAGRTDRELQKVVAGIEASLPRHLAALDVRNHLESAWKAGFTSIELNRKNPPVWMRLTPRRLSYGGYAVTGRRLELRLGLDAGVETFVGERPAPPEVLPLPPSGKLDGPSGFHIIAPVIASYSELEPVLHHALDKLAAKPIEVPAIGAVDVEFGRPKIYATAGGRLAIGLPIRAGSRRFNLPTRGLVWLTGLPYNEPNSPVVKVRDLRITGTTDRRSADLLMQIALSPMVLAGIEGALSQNFTHDIEKLRDKIDRALADKRIGDFILGVHFRDLRFGVVQVLGQGAYLPVEVTGEGHLRLAPRGKPQPARNSR